MPRRMNKPAWAYVVENLPRIRQARFTDSTGTERHLGENGLALLMYLTDRLNSYGTVYMGAKTMSEDTGIHLATVKRLLAGFEQLTNWETGQPWLTRVGTVQYQGRGSASVEYALTLVPGLWTGQGTGLETRPGSRPGSQTGSQVATRTETKANNGAELSPVYVPEPEPQPEPHPQPQERSVSTEPGGDGRGGLDRHKAVMAGCIEAERKRTPKGIGAPLMRILERDYGPLVVEALRDLPGQTDTELVKRCVALRNGEQVKAPAPRLDPDCPDCKGKGILHRPGIPTDQGWVGQPPVPCHCTQGDTHRKSETRHSA